jgi:hypothetical protein
VRDRENFNWLIGVGYILVAVVILMNYLSPKTSAKAGAPSSILDRQVSEEDNLRRQLQEERKIKLEMSEMINRLQSNFLQGGQAGADKIASGEGSALSISDQDFAEYLKKDFSFIRKRNADPGPVPGPVQSGRNPFMPFYETRARSDEKIVAEGPVVFLRTSPEVPAPFLGTWNIPRVHGSTR